MAKQPEEALMCLRYNITVRDDSLFRRDHVR